MEKMRNGREMRKRWEMEHKGRRGKVEGKEKGTIKRRERERRDGTEKTGGYRRERRQEKRTSIENGKE